MSRPAARAPDEIAGRAADQALAALLGHLPPVVTGGDGLPINPSPTQAEPSQRLGDGCDGCDGFPDTSHHEQRTALELVEWALSPETEGVAPGLVEELRQAVQLPGRSWEAPAVRLAARVWGEWRRGLSVESDPLVVLAARLLGARGVSA